MLQLKILRTAPNTQFSQKKKKIDGRNINLRYADDTALNGRKQRGIKELLSDSEGGK